MWPPSWFQSVMVPWLKAGVRKLQQRLASWVKRCGCLLTLEATGLVARPGKCAGRGASSGGRQRRLMAFDAGRGRFRDGFLACGPRASLATGSVRLCLICPPR